MAGVSNSDEQNFWPGYVDTLVNMVMFLVLMIVILAMAVMFFSIKARNDALKSTVPLTEPGKMAHEKVHPGMADVLPKNPTMQDMRNLINRLQEKLHQNELRYQPSGLSTVAKPKENNMGTTDRQGTSHKLEEAAGLNPADRPDENKMGKGEKVEDANNVQAAGAQASGVENFALRPSSLIIRFKPGALDMTEQEAKRMSEVFAKHFDYQKGSTQSFLLVADAAQGLSESNRMAFYRVVAVRNHLMGVTGVPAAKIGQKIQPVPPNAISGMEALEVRITKVE